MRSAQDLYNEIVGEDDFYDDYYSEDDEFVDEDQPTPAPAPQQPVAPRPPIEYYRCEACRRGIPVKEKENHENSKGHRSNQFDKRFKNNVEKWNREREEESLARRELWRSVFEDSRVIEKEMLPLRLVCSQWNDYFCDRKNWGPLYEVHKDSPMPLLDHCFLSYDFPLINLSICHVLGNPTSLEAFLKQGEARELHNVWAIKIQVDKVIHLSDKMEQFYALMEQCWAYDLRVTVACDGIPTEDFRQFCERLFASLAANRNVYELRTFLDDSHGRTESPVNPIRLLNDNKRIKILHIGSHWFGTPPRMFGLTAAEKERLKKSLTFTFDNMHMEELKIIREHGGIDNKHAKYFLRSLHDNTTLRKLYLPRLHLRSSAMEEVQKLLEVNHTITDLDVSFSPGGFDLVTLRSNRGLETLNLSGLNVKCSKSSQESNTTLRNLKIDGCSFTSSRIWKALPRSLTELSISNIQTSLTETFFDDMPSYLPNLQTLDVSNNRFFSLTMITEMIKKAPPSLTTLRAFTDSRYTNTSDFWDISCFEVHPSIRSCDLINYPGMDPELVKWTETQVFAPRAPSRHLTKGAR